MKNKILLFLILLSSISFAQVSNGGEQEFDYGIKNNSTQTVTTPTYLGTVGADGTYGKILLADLQGKKAFLPTGLIKNGLLTINADPTKFDISAGIGIISNFDNPENPTSVIVNFPAFTGITPTYLTTGNITYVAINSTPAIVMQATPFTESQRRDLIILGAVVHSNLTTINTINNISAPTNAVGNQLHDFIDAVGALNIAGNKYSANGANLQLNKSAGTIFKMGSNFSNDWKNPHEITQSAGTSLSFRYRTQNGTEDSDRINLDPELYDLNNVLTSVPNNKFTIQTVVMFQTGLTRILYGQNVYDDLATAKNAVFTRNFVVEPNSKENGIIRAYIIMKNNTTSLQNVADADILEAQKFGGVASGGVALTLSNIVSALGYTPENVANKATTLTASSTLYPNNDAVIAGLAGKEPSFTKNTAFNKNFGTTSGTVAEGNDSRILAVSTHTHGLGRHKLNAPAFIDGLTSSNFRDILFGSSAITDNISTSRWNSVPSALSGLAQYGNMLAWSGNDTHAFIATNHNSPKVRVGGGLNNGINWSKDLAFSDGTGATGTWGINISGNAASATNWGGRPADLNAIQTDFDLVLTRGASDAVTRLTPLPQFRTWLGLGSNAYSSTPYLPLSGGTLTGAISGTSATFSETVTSSPATLSNHVVVKSQLDAVKPYKVYTALLSIGSGTCEEQTVYENTIGVTPSFSISSSTTTVTFAGTTGNYWGHYTVSKNPSDGTSTRITGQANTFMLYDANGALMNWTPTGGTRYISVEIRVYL